MPHKIIMIAVAVAVLSGGMVVGMMNDDEPSGAPTTAMLTLSDDGSSVTIDLGDVLVISLEGNPTTGYTWEPQDLDETVLTLSGEPVYEPASDALGASGTLTFTFEPVAAGEVDLTLVYHRPWESVPPLDTFGVTVTVR